MTLIRLLLAALLLEVLPAAHADSGRWRQIALKAFYVAPSGSDSAPGSIAAPFATIAHCQAAMQASGDVKTCYIQAGTYNLTSLGDPCGISANGEAIDLEAADNGETFSGWPLDPPGSAILAGGSTSNSTGVYAMFCLNGGASGITINDLQIQHVISNALYAFGSFTFTNNIVHDSYGTTSALVQGTAPSSGTLAGSIVDHNEFYNGAQQAVGFVNSHPTELGNVAITNNFAYNVCTATSDCGAIYLQETNATHSTGIVVENNYVRDVFPSNNSGAWGPSGGVCIYLDDGLSNATVSGNVCEGGAAAKVLLHGGNNDTITSNLFDLAGTSNNILAYQLSTATGATPMTGNTFEHNIIIGNNAASAGSGYVGLNTPTNPALVTDNAYYNYGTGGVVSYACSGGVCGANSTSTTQDNNPTYENPSISGWDALIATGSPVFSAPVSFVGYPVDHWGPASMYLWEAGTAPSNPH